jgi:Flp pilus assembly protein TadG
VVALLPLSHSGPTSAKETPVKRNDRGAAVVEFAIVLPLLVALLIGIAEFGRAYYTQTTLSGAAREGVRVMALKDSRPAARSAAVSAAKPLAISEGQVTVSPASPGTCSAGLNATVTIAYTMPFITGLFGPTINLTGKGVMRCGG